MTALDNPRRSKPRSRLPWVLGLALIGWPGVAGLLVLTGQADLFLASWPDITWMVMLADAILAPPRWIAAVAALSGIGLMIWYFFRQPTE